MIAQCLHCVFAPPFVVAEKAEGQCGSGLSKVPARVRWACSYRTMKIFKRGLMVAEEELVEASKRPSFHSVWIEANGLREETVGSFKFASHEGKHPRDPHQRRMVLRVQA